MLAAFAAPAQAAPVTREVATTGTDTPTCGTGMMAPCKTVQYAVTQAAGGDTIDIAAGTYTEQVSVTKQLTIHGQSGGARPLIQFCGTNFATAFTLASGSAGTTLSHLGIQGSHIGTFDCNALAIDVAANVTDVGLTAATGALNVGLGAAGTMVGPSVTATKIPSTSGGIPFVFVDASATLQGMTVTDADFAPAVELGVAGDTLFDSTVSNTLAGALDIAAGALARRDTLTGPGGGITTGASGQGGGTVTDSVSTSTGGGPAVSSSQGLLTLRNDTVIARASTANGLEAVGSGANFLSAGMIDAKNVIVRGGGSGFDVKADPTPTGGQCFFPPCSPGTVTISYSNFRTSGGGGPLNTSADHNQSGDPLFVNGTPGPAQDFHIASSSSPVIGAGVADPANGPTDRDGVTHPNPPTIGAYERSRSNASPPSNIFTLGKLKLNKKKGTATLTVKLPGAGLLKLTGKGVNVVSESASGGTATLLIKPIGKAKKSERKKHKVKLTISVTFTPIGGSANTLSKKVTLKLKKKH